MEKDITTDDAEPEPGKRLKHRSSDEREIIHLESDGGHLLLPSGVRCGVQASSRLDRFLLEYNFYFLPCIGLVLWALFLTTT